MMSLRMWWGGLVLTATLLGCAPTQDPQQLQPIGVGPCTQGSGSRVLRSLGLLNGASYWDCKPPPATSFAGRFTTADGTLDDGSLIMVSGGSINLQLAYTGVDNMAGRNVVVALSKERGYFWAKATAADVDVSSSVLHVKFFIDRAAGDSDQNLTIAIDDGTGTQNAPKPGKYLTIPLKIIHVGTGDVQVNLSWTTMTDVDLHVIEPGGEEIYFGNRDSATGGQLDLDSYAACGGEHKYNENIYWPDGAAPHGEYTVWVHYWSACQELGETKFRVTVLRAPDIVETFQNSFFAVDNHGSRTITHFSY